MPRYSIIIPVCGNQKLTDACLDSIKENSNNFEIIIVDNGGDYRRRANEKVIENEKNLGFPVAVNQGIKAANGEIIIILNNDTIVTPDWLERLNNHFDKFDMIGPVSNAVSGPQQVLVGDLSDKEAIYIAAKTQYKENNGLSYPWHRLVFFCVAIKREVIDKIGLLDEQFSPGNFEDDDFCLRAIEAGFKLGIAQDTFIYHAGSATHKSLNLDFAGLMATNQFKFQAKWSMEKYNILREQNNSGIGGNLIKNKKTLALVMIVKNEEKGLERAVNSCRDFVDEIVIAVDSSSTDNTEKIAAKLATKLKILEWNDNYAEARNFAAEGVKSDWILFLDGHEFVKNSPNIQQHLNCDCDGLLTTVEMETGSQFRNPRIYKNGCKFSNAVHERIDSKKVLPYLDFIVKHDREGGQDLKSALERNAQRDEQTPRILTQELKKNPKNLHALLHLSLFYQGRSQFRKSLKYQRRYLRYSNNKGERWFIYFNRALCYLSTGKLFKAFWAANRADNETPGRWEISKLNGLIFYSRRKFFKAAEHFVGSFKINTGDQTYKPWQRDDGGTFNLLGECFYNLGDYYKAFVAFKKASEKVLDQEFKTLYDNRAKLMFEISKSQK